ncbi:16S rRNA (uracil(1498)-N(3))-methyltransferase [Isoptericola variabilis]|uniref:Ribosomal RNA small subunit methyltransferase E n=1 Tax=Isoptericola variabilis (strain 225) TaxID=743718 RepID=F6FXI7_ISOV2|nr:16S rRNA (uracil(1498)-N(3))-methyltransferase [Isoptericola variabilis]AEG44715.1 Ribosomal RNA small subunit methyltransferase E [Isoptericola variabilis 225]TWH33426.1 16S rRNA (uracil1498-N3)-methyltransferase [Isoptericola variabilis J7]
MSAPVFLAEGGGLADVAPGDAYLLDGTEGRHAGVVQRRGPGERLDVVDGAGVRLRCVVEQVTGDGVQLRVAEVVREPAPGVVLTLVQALAKGDRDELAVEAAVEVGVDAVVPWQAERSIVVWRGPRAAKSHARWVATVRAAVKQARRAWVPPVAEPVTTKQLAVRTRDVVAAGGAVVVLHEEAQTPLGAVVLPGVVDRDAGGDAGAAPELLVVVGPEGGISDAELALLIDAGAVAARLGPHVLRTSTAGPVAVALLSERLGRWA